MDVYEELLRLRGPGQKCAIATIVRVRGSIFECDSFIQMLRQVAAYLFDDLRFFFAVIKTPSMCRSRVSSASKKFASQ